MPALVAAAESTAGPKPTPPVAAPATGTARPPDPVAVTTDAEAKATATHTPDANTRKADMEATSTNRLLGPPPALGEGDVMTEPFQLWAKQGFFEHLKRGPIGDLANYSKDHLIAEIRRFAGTHKVEPAVVALAITNRGPAKAPTLLMRDRAEGRLSDCKKVWVNPKFHPSPNT